ncbi:DUF5610 domain-containing protein [Herbaspirillum autotrophicum]|uniref:DUF5610 domain-containing protein n=1 Tax=Herbaspirillum autotrophicum TaxID=180195 RepID=UPI00067BF4D1|nr:DUF5610 domain-containing protein [Herbaspirillum autotrophicum]
MSISATSNDPGTVASPAATTASGTNADNATNAASAASTDAASQADKLTPASAKQQLNAAILQASLDVSLTSQNDPLSLLYKSAIENLNEALKSQMGDNAIQNSAKEDNTPEATAGRIVSFISQAYEMYRGQNKDQDEATTVDKFMSIIQGGVDQGFKEARGILSGLKVLNGDIASNIDKTYDLVQKGLADFAAAKKAPPPATDGGTTAPTDKPATNTPAAAKS